MIIKKIILETIKVLLLSEIENMIRWAFYLLIREMGRNLEDYFKG